MIQYEPMYKSVIGVGDISKIDLGGVTLIAHIQDMSDQDLVTDEIISAAEGMDKFVLLIGEDVPNSLVALLAENTGYMRGSKIAKYLVSFDVVNGDRVVQL